MSIPHSHEGVAPGQVWKGDDGRLWCVDAITEIHVSWTDPMTQTDVVVADSPEQFVKNMAERVVPAVSSSAGETDQRAWAGAGEVLESLKEQLDRALRERDEAREALAAIRREVRRPHVSVERIARAAGSEEENRNV